MDSANSKQTAEKENGGDIREFFESVDVYIYTPSYILSPSSRMWLTPYLSHCRCPSITAIERRPEVEHAAE